MSIHNARRALSDRLIRVARPHRILDPQAGPLIAVKLHVITRKTLGGIQTDLDRRALGRCRAAGPGPLRGRARRPGSAAAARTATTPSRAPSSAAASSPAVPSGAPSPGASDSTSVAARRSPSARGPSAPCARTIG